jgi:sulfide:quinone oxidoreductase
MANILILGGGFVRVDQPMRVLGAERMYAAGDAVYFSGPKTGHMAVNQAEVVAENLAAELEGRAPSARYEHEMLLVVDAGNRDSVFLHKRLWEEGDKRVSWGPFWGWAKRAHERYWNAIHS